LRSPSGSLCSTGAVQLCFWWASWWFWLNDFFVFYFFCCDWLGLGKLVCSFCPWPRGVL
jgi:hypothetical protein